MLKKGDKCWVRLYSGEVVESAYECERLNKQHLVKLFRGGLALADSKLTDCKVGGILDCRFVCMTGMNKGAQ